MAQIISFFWSAGVVGIVGNLTDRFEIALV